MPPEWLVQRWRMRLQLGNFLVLTKRLSRLLDRLVLSSYVELMEWARLTEDVQALDQENA